MSSNIKKCHIPAPEAPVEKKRPRSALGEKLTRNLAAATLVLLTVIGVKEASAPNGSSFLQAVQNAVESEWDENVGRLTYVGSMLSESVQVFGRAESYDLQSPVCTPAVQAWSPASPYLLYENAGDVFAAAAGEVCDIYHDDDERYIVRILHTNGLEGLYYGLDTCAVKEGDEVSASTLLGMSSGGEFALEMRRAGKSIDCSAYLKER